MVAVPTVTGQHWTWGILKTVIEEARDCLALASESREIVARVYDDVEGRVGGFAVIKDQLSLAFSVP